MAESRVRHCQEPLGPHLPWKLLRTSICPGTLQMVFSMMEVASGYCTLRLFFLQWIQVSLFPPATLPALSAPVTTPTAGGTYLLRRPFISFKRHGRKQRDWQGLWCSQAPRVDIWPEGLEGLYVLPWPHFQFLESNPVLAMRSIIYLTCPGLLLPITMNEDTGKLSSS